MPVDHSKNGFLKDIGTDWVALAANGAPLSRAATEDGVRRAAPDADSYITGKKSKAEKVEAAPAPAVEPVTPEPAAVEPPTEPVSPEPPVDIVEPEAVDPRLDPDGDGKMGGSEKGENATASKTRRQRKPA